MAAADDPALGALADAWSALGRDLEAKGRALNDEVAHYPTPIARCDDQLPELLARRSRVFHELRRMSDTGAVKPGVEARDWLRSVDEFLAASEGPVRDPAEAALYDGLRRAL